MVLIQFELIKGSDDTRVKASIACEFKWERTHNTLMT